MPTINKNLEGVALSMVHRGEKVFSGTVKDLPGFSASDQTVDYVKLFNTEGALIVSMKYQDFEAIFDDEIP